MKRAIAKSQAAVLKNLVAQAALIKAATALLFEEANSEISTRRLIAGTIRVLEDNGDCLVRENAAYFASSSPSIFSPSSYEPEDLRRLTSCLDDILDAIEEVAFRLSAYQFAWLIPGVSRCCHCLKTCADGIYVAVDGMAQQDDVAVESLDIPTVTKQGDLLLRESVSELFSSDGEALTVFTNKEICSGLGTALQSCKSAIKQLLILEVSSG